MHKFFRLIALASMLALPASGAETTDASTTPQPVVYLIGDSTVNNGTRGQMGWGKPFASCFDPQQVKVVNRARGGRSSRTFLTEGLWQEVLADLKPGDFVLIQFGHNDNGPMDEGRARASIKGVGDESRVITNKTTGKVETVYSYGWYLRRYIADTKAKGATPVVLSLVPRNIWKDGKVVRASGDFARWAAEAARSSGAAFIDLNGIVADRYDQLGSNQVAKLFGGDHTHTNPDGALVNAACVAAGLRKLEGFPLAPLVKEPVSVAGSTTASDSGAKAYVFSYFINNGEDGLHLAGSRDGYSWLALNNGASFLKPEVGESKLMRDPCLLRGPDGTFHMVWTTAWNGKTIGYAHSRDLVKWSAQQAIPVMAHEPAALNCWAPEIFWDHQKPEFLIFWATTITNRFLETADKSEGKYNHRMYVTTTRDFQTFTQARLFFDPGFNVIDATLLPAFGKHYLVFKDETVRPAKKHLRLVNSASPAGPFGDMSPPFTPDWVEGPTWLKLWDYYVVYFDVYRDHRYGAARSKDLVTWEDVSTRLSMPKGLRHGTALEVDEKILQELEKLGR